MKLKIKEIDGVPVTCIPDGSRTVIGYSIIVSDIDIDINISTFQHI